MRGYFLGLDFFLLKRLLLLAAKTRAAYKLSYGRVISSHVLAGYVQYVSVVLCGGLADVVLLAVEMELQHRG